VTRARRPGDRGPTTTVGAAQAAQAATASLTSTERDEVRAVLNTPEHVDKAPANVYHELLDQGVYLASVSTMYRVLREHDEVHERRRQATHPARVKPELVATAPNSCWSWDITKLLRSANWTNYYLYVIIDIYSRYVVGWLLAERVGGAGREAARRPRCHQDPLQAAHQQRQPLLRGPGQDAEVPARLLRTLRQPHRRRRTCQRFFTWHNTVHYHSAIGYHHPIEVHYGHAETIRHARADVLTIAYTRNPERFVRKHPNHPPYPAPPGSTNPTKQTPTGAAGRNNEPLNNLPQNLGTHREHDGSKDGCLAPLDGTWRIKGQ
jgi:putative transposase